ncbi:MAG TPA: hypothetical protein VF132_14075 [Rudaea sp.]
MSTPHLYLLQMITIFVPWLAAGAVGRVMLRGIPFRFSLALLVLLTAVGIEECVSPLLIVALNPDRLGPATLAGPHFIVLVATGLCTIATSYALSFGLGSLLTRRLKKAA